MERVMVKDGSGDMISHMFHELRGSQYEHINNDYFSQVEHENTDDNYVANNLINEDRYQGKYMHTGEIIRKLYAKGAYSNLTTTGVSNYMRHTREIQAVGCSTAVSTDLTFAVNKNYHSNEFNNGKACTSTITTGEGMKASACIVPGGDSKYIAHQQEMFARRANVNPEVFVTDDMPKNIGMYKEILGDILFCLGLFHFVQRITKTLVPGHEDFEAAVRDLTSGLSHDNQHDLDNVKHALKNGFLGANNKKHTDNEINSMMQSFSWNRNYRKYIRMHLKDALVINSHLNIWLTKWDNIYDEEIDSELFTAGTHKAIRLAIKNTIWLVNGLKKEDKYIEVKPSKFSICRLSTFINLMGAEQKGEAGHLHLAHYANGGMEASLADALALAGISNDNCRMYQKLRIGQLNEVDRSKVNASFHSWPSHLNHHRLNNINMLATKNGAKPPFKHIRILPPDNGERFMSAYITILNGIEKKYTTLQENESLRCPCSKCYHNPIPLSHSELSSASSQQQQQQQQQPVPAAVLASVPVPRQQQQQTKKKKRGQKRKVPTASLANILPTVQTTHSPQLMYLQQQQIYYHNSLMQLLPQHMYYNQLHPQPVPMTPPVQYTNRYCCQKYEEHRKLKKEGQPPHSWNCHQDFRMV